MNDNVEIVYDRECPVCEFYCRRVAAADAGMRIDLVDARDGGELMDDITALGLDIDEGMVVRRNGRFYYGSDAIAELARVQGRDGLFNRLARAAFGGPRRAALLYPIGKALRNLLLKLLGRRRINNLDLEDNDRF